MFKSCLFLLCISGLASADITGVTLLPRQDNSKDGNPGRCVVKTSVDGVTWKQAADVTLANTNTSKTIGITRTSDTFIKVDFLTSANGGQNIALAELVLLNENGTQITPADWSITVDSQTPITSYPFTGASALLDGDPSTFWITDWVKNSPLPHSIQIRIPASTSSFLVTWDVSPEEEQVTQYTVYWALDGAVDDTKIEVSTTQAILQNLVKGKRYRVQASASNSTGEGPRSDTLLFVVSASGNPIKLPLSLPSAPTGLKISIVPVK